MCAERWRNSVLAQKKASSLAHTLKSLTAFTSTVSHQTLQEVQQAPNDFGMVFTQDEHVALLVVNLHEARKTVDHSFAHLFGSAAPELTQSTPEEPENFNHVVDHCQWTHVKVATCVHKQSEEFRELVQWFTLSPETVQSP